MRLGGTIFTHNCLTLDYCLDLALRSLLDVCDEVVCIDAESTDGTLEYLSDMGVKDRRLTIGLAKWKPIPDGKGQWLSDLGNTALSLMRSPYHIALQADEVLHEEDYGKIRECANRGGQYLVHRLNFWKDSRHIVPPGKVCGHNICRMGPKTSKFIGDAENIDLNAQPVGQSSVRIFHYGFIRKAEAQIIKGIKMESEFLGTYNPIYNRMKETGSRESYDNAKEITGDLIEFRGTHPAKAREWLRERVGQP